MARIGLTDAMWRDATTIRRHYSTRFLDFFTGFAAGGANNEFGAHSHVVDPSAKQISAHRELIQR